MPLPNFLIIGAARSGTTSLYEYVRQHPDVFMSPVKEPNYFTFMDGRIADRGPRTGFVRQTSVTSRAAYEALFAGAGSARAVGEASVSYLHAPGVPERIRDALPDVRLLAVLRHPAERAHAGWLAMRRDGHEAELTFEGALRAEEAASAAEWPLRTYVKYGFYHRYLSRYFARFPRERIRIWLFEDLRADPERLLRELFAFLGVDPTLVPDMSRRHARTGIVRNPLLRLLWTRSFGLRNRVRPYVSSRLRELAFERITRDTIKPALLPDTRQRLVEVFRQDIVALQDLIGRDLSHWLA